jgi:hypothetical protein
MEKFNYLLVKQLEQMFFYIAAFGMAEWLLNHLHLTKYQQLFYYITFGLISIFILLFSSNSIYNESNGSF